MKRNLIYTICAGVLLLCGGCSEVQQDAPAADGQTGMVGVRLAGTLPAEGDGLETPLYIFRRAAGSQDDYLFERSYATVADGDALKLPIAELKTGEYRFLMVAQPADGEWLSLRTAEGTPFETGARWNELRLLCETGAASLDGYCGVTDMDGAAIIAEGRVELSLKRIAGQPLFDIFRTGGSLDEPVGVVSPDVMSVIDRVAKIEITYSGQTSSLRFGDDNLPVPDEVAAQPFTQTIIPDMDGFGVAIPQSEKGLTAAYAALRGSLRVEGKPLLPSDAKLRVRMVFTYYDTTPVCGNTDGRLHTTDCYPMKRLTLDLPAATAATGLPVASDCYTVNRAGLRCDRIIDIPVGGGIETGFDWF